MRRKRRRSGMDPIRRGTTPTLFFEMPYPMEYIEGGYMTFEQRGELLFEKTFQDTCVQVEDGRVSVELATEETLMLTEVEELRVQVMVCLIDGKTAVSGNYEIPVQDTPASC